MKIQMLRNISLLFLFISIVSCTQPKQENNLQTAIEQIKADMEKSKDAWNKGDFEGFMDVYWKSDSLVFMGIKKVTYGWQTTIDNYKKKYPDADKRGTLKYEYVSIKPLNDDYIIMIGKFTLLHDGRENDEGYFSLTWKNFNGKWKIIIDHT